MMQKLIATTLLFATVGISSKTFDKLDKYAKRQAASLKKQFPQLTSAANIRNGFIHAYYLPELHETYALVVRYENKIRSYTLITVDKKGQLSREKNIDQKAYNCELKEYQKFEAHNILVKLPLAKHKS